jgi:FkbH-like protein
MNSEKTLSYFINESEKLIDKKFKKKIRIALLSSHTINGLKEIVHVKCAEYGILASIYEGPYNQYSQEILNVNSNFYKFKPDIVFLIINSRDIFDELYHFPYSKSIDQKKVWVTEKISETNYLIDFFTKQCNATMIISNLNIPTDSSYGISEQKSNYSLSDMIQQFNSTLNLNYKNSEHVAILDFDSFVSKHGEDNIFDPRQYFFADIRISMKFLPHYGEEIMKFLISFLGLTKKCLVLDLDNTLWGGIAGEDGYNGIKLGPEPPGNAFVEFQKTILSLHQRGIILAINSKNNFDDAIQIIREHPYMILNESHFSSIKINWNDKVSNIKQIAEELNIGLDSIVFLDDDKVNQEFVKSILPDVFVPELPEDPSMYSKYLQNLIQFSVLKITNEDKQRGKMYAQQKIRNELKISSPDLTTFLKKLNLKITIKKVDAFSLPRVSQLILKTNQFNLTTKRYQESEINLMINDPNFFIGYVNVKDKFGDNGITGVFIIKKESEKIWIIDTFLLSCRVMGRDIEKGMFVYIVNEAKKHNIDQIKSKFIPTQKNKPIEDFLPNCNFKKEGDYWTYMIESELPFPKFLELEV